MDALYFLRHSRFEDVEIMYSLRSVNMYMPWVRKVWIFGDRPVFLTDDISRIQHVPHEYAARVGPFKTPVTNFFLLFFLASLIPELDFEFLWFCDDFILLDYLSEEDARKDRCLQDLSQVKGRGRGLWKDSLWRTYDLLKRLGYTGYNFETHAPTYFTKKRVFEAYCEFKDWVTEDRWYGMLGPTAILNHAYAVESFDLTWLKAEGRHVGFHGKAPSYEEVAKQCRGKGFLNFDDDAFGEGIRRYLAKRFPTPSIYEQPDGVARAKLESFAPAQPQARDAMGYPPVVIPDRRHFPQFLNQLGLLGEGAEIGTQRGQFAATILRSWKGRCLHCVDPWRDMRDDANYIDKSNVSQAEHDRNFHEARQRLSPFGGRCRLHRLTSREARKQFEDGSLDFVYLDARHDRSSLWEDLNGWLPKVRSGGILAGHDYLDGVLPSGHFEVKSTVDAWAAEQGLSVVCSGEHVWRSWIIPIRPS